MPIKPETTICLFACHFKNKGIPSYLKLYLSELKKYSGKLVLINEDDAFLETDSEFLAEHAISNLILPNIGHDFGSWMRALEKLDMKAYTHFLFANDSCILTQPLKAFFGWLNTTHFDFAGLINSNERKFHVQSYFTIANQTGLKEIQNQFKKHGIVKDKRKLIKYYEIGISQVQLSKKNVISTFLNIPKMNKNNPMFHQPLDLIKNKFPLIKKQLVFDQMSESDVIALKSAGIYTGPQVIKDQIIRYSEFQKVNWNDLFQDQPINN